MAAPQQEKLERLPFLDGVRGVAIAAVFLFHTLLAAYGKDRFEWNGWLPDFDGPLSFRMLAPLTYGWAGVPIFFAVSGFCIHLSYHTSATRRWGEFFVRRFFRIYPPYCFALVCFFIAPAWMGSGGTAMQLIAHLGLVQNLNTRTFYGINPSFWSVAVEAQLYLVYPLLVALQARAGWRTTLLCVAGLELAGRYSESVMARAFGVQVPFWVLHLPFCYWGTWAIGAYVADCYLKRTSSALAKIPFAAVAAMALAAPLFKPTAPLGYPLFGLATAMVLDRFVAQKWWIPQTGSMAAIWKHLSLLGMVSYSFYLLHQPIVETTSAVVASVTTAVPGPLFVFACACAWYPVVLGLSFVWFTAFERPSIAMGRAFIAGRRSLSS